MFKGFGKEPEPSPRKKPVKREKAKPSRQEWQMHDRGKQEKSQESLKRRKDDTRSKKGGTGPKYGK
jgi:hypothetical protein